MEADEEHFFRQLFHYGIVEEFESSKNPYITRETLVLRFVRKITERTGIRWPVVLDKNSPYVFGREIQDEILHHFEKHKGSFSIDDQTFIQHILSKDSFQASEVSKFVTCWSKKFYPDSQEESKRNTAKCILKWFAVDGFMGDQAKQYMHDVFKLPCANEFYQSHIDGVRALYMETSLECPEQIKAVLLHIFKQIPNSNQIDEKLEFDFTDIELSFYTLVYLKCMKGESHIKQIINWKLKQEKQYSQLEEQQQQQIKNRLNKRKREMPDEDRKKMKE